MAVVIWTSGPALASESLIIDGTGDSQEILRKLSERYEELHPGARVMVPDSVGSGGGIKSVLQGQAGLARTARPLKSKEAESGLSQVLFAWSPVVFAAHPSVASVRSVTLDQILDIYAGKTGNWTALGGPDHKLYPVNREEGDSSRTVINAFLAKALDNAQGMGTAGKVFYTTGDTVLALKRNAYAIGFVPLSEAKAAGLHMFALDSVFPDEAAVKGKTYPLVTPFYLVKPSDPSPLAIDFIDFILSEPARAMMREQGVFPADRN